MLRIKMVRSLIGQKRRNRLIIASLGLHKLGQTVIQPDNASIRGMIHHVKHMLQVEVVDAPAEAKPAKVAKAKGTEAPAAEATTKPKRTKKSEEPATA